MKNEIEVRVTYILMGLLFGALLATAFPIVQHWPELETRLGEIQ